MNDAEIPDEVVTAAQLADAEWNRTRRRVDGRGWASVPADQVRRLIAAAVTAERERIADMADRNGAVCPGDDGTSCYFSALIRVQP